MSDFHKRIIFVLVLLIIIILLFSYLSLPKNDILKYSMTKNIIKDESNIPSYKSNQEKYKKKSCKELCDKEICTDYELQLKKYNNCKKCESKGMCYQPFQGTCFKCKNLKSCEEVYGCNFGEPIDPFKKECEKCWPHIY
jgi:hypothetical protein